MPFAYELYHADWYLFFLKIRMHLPAPNGDIFFVIRIALRSLEYLLHHFDYEALALILPLHSLRFNFSLVVGFEFHHTFFFFTLILGMPLLCTCGSCRCSARFKPSHDDGLVTLLLTCETWLFSPEDGQADHIFLWNFWGVRRFWFDMVAFLASGTPRCLGLALQLRPGVEFWEN